MEANKVPLNELGGAGDVTKVMRLMTEAEARDTFFVGRPLYTRYAPGLSSEAGRAITRSGFWSGMGFVGASIFASGLLLLINGGATAGISPVLLLAGGAMAWFGWRNAWKAINGIDQASPEIENAAPAARAAGDVDAPWLVPMRTRTVSTTR